MHKPGILNLIYVYDVLLKYFYINFTWHLFIELIYQCIFLLFGVVIKFNVSVYA